MRNNISGCRLLSLFLSLARSLALPSSLSLSFPFHCLSCMHVYTHTYMPTRCRVTASQLCLSLPLYLPHVHTSSGIQIPKSSSTTVSAHSSTFETRPLVTAPFVGVGESPDGAGGEAAGVEVCCIWRTAACIAAAAAVCVHVRRGRGGVEKTVNFFQTGGR